MKLLLYPSELRGFLTAASSSYPSATRPAATARTPRPRCGKTTSPSSCARRNPSRRRAFAKGSRGIARMEPRRAAVVFAASLQVDNVIPGPQLRGTGGTLASKLKRLTRCPLLPALKRWANKLCASDAGKSKLSNQQISFVRLPCEGCGRERFSLPPLLHFRA